MTFSDDKNPRHKKLPVCGRRNGSIPFDLNPYRRVIDYFLISLNEIYILMKLVISGERIEHGKCIYDCKSGDVGK